MEPILEKHGGPASHLDLCRLVVRKEKGLSEILQFAIAGLEIGQQVIVMAGPACLKDIARGLSENGLRAETLLHSGRLVFLTAPNCLPKLLKPGDPFQRGSLPRNASVVRWVTDWSWAFSNSSELATIRSYQNRLHEFIRPLSAISMCTVHCEKLERTSLLALLADHRRAAKIIEASRHAAQA
jgi:hypothetical protein